MAIPLTLVLSTDTIFCSLYVYMFLEEDKEESPGHALQVVHPEYQPVPHKLGDTNNN